MHCTIDNMLDNIQFKTCPLTNEIGMALNQCIGIECRLNVEKNKLIRSKCDYLCKEIDDGDELYFCSLIKTRKIKWKSKINNIWE